MDARTYISALETMGREDYKKHKDRGHLVSVPRGKAGPWTVRHFETALDLAYMRLARDGRPPGLGKFTALSHENRGIVMSDTIPEIKDFLAFADLLQGRVLISGLGLGMAVQILTKDPRYSGGVESITVVEKDANVIKLTAGYYRKADPRVTIVHGDALTWTPPKGARYHSAWHDIWDNICAENLPDMKAIRRHYSRYVEKGQQFCWGQLELKRQRYR